MKVILMGNAGSGKSTLAKELSAKNSAERLSLDEVAFKRGTPERRPLQESIQAVKHFIQENESWIIEGCYSDIIEAILDECEELIFLNPGIDTCVAHCRTRSWESEKYSSKQEQDANLENLIAWVRDYETRQDEYGLQQHRALFDSFAGNKRELTLSQPSITLSAYNTSDKQEVQQLFTRTFAESDRPAEGELVGQLAQRLMDETDAENASGFVASEHQEIVGCIFFTPLKFDSSIKAALLSPVAVRTEHQGQGVGQRLIRFGMEQMGKSGVELVFTYGDPNYYSKVGFKPVSQQVVKPPFELTQPEGWLVLSLTGAEIKPLPGVAQCVDAFNDPALW
ncbi:GNAT family N-acetyltransferase [Marinobacter apostichopi]|uniref:GNAT family N-acetyltransferase n=1 Tax=Marinobacter apostichopi TaxID=3035454 RepID=UPI002572CB06|nr:GNAT family N-acetyltransferase [Marinobacter sp. LA51]